MHPQTARTPTLIPTNWFCFTPQKAHLDTATGRLLVDLQHAAFGLPVTGTRQ